MIKRTIKKQILEKMELFPVIVITGPRQVGKSTLVVEIAKEKNYKYVTLDNFEERNLALQDPKFFIESKGYPLVIDEIQYAPILLEIIESIANKQRIENQPSNGLFILTGSQTFQMMKGVTQSLAGRATIINMQNLSVNEIMKRNECPFVPVLNKYIDKEVDRINADDLFHKIIKGFYPEMYKNSNMDVYSFYSAYVSTYLDRDVSEIINIKNKTRFHDFLMLLASLTGQELVFESLSKHLGITVVTIKEWISALETSGLIYLLKPYNEISITKRIVKRPKIYFTDTGLACHLIKIYDYKNLMISRFSGQLLETYVFNELRKGYLNNGYPFDIYYYRDNNQNEIDFILLSGGTLHLIECKKGMLFDLKDIKAFNCLSETKYRIGDSGIICLTDKIYSLKKDIHVFPVLAI
ncbi:MAG: DUF4143 domain-containing protein [Erysipelotrichales bacterium]|nr:DUF4143 domain-containing protein [Erysipelotrichales bacterium]